MSSRRKKDQNNRYYWNFLKEIQKQNLSQDKNKIKLTGKKLEILRNSS